MSDRSRASRPRRSRCTTAVAESRAHDPRWWVEHRRAETPTYGPKPVEMRQRVLFQSADPLDYVAWARGGLVVLALLMPLVFLARVDGARAMLSRMFSDSKTEALRCLAKGQTLQAVAPIRAAVTASASDAVHLRELAAAAATALPGEARRCYNQLEKMGATTDADRAHHSMLLSALKDFTGAKALLLKVGEKARNEALTQQAWLALWQAAGDFGAAADVLEKLLAAKGASVLPVCLDVMEAAVKHPLSPDVRERLENLVAQSLSLSGSIGLQAKEATRIAGMSWHTPRSRLEVSKALRSVSGNPAEFRLAAVRLGYPATVDGSFRQALRAAWLEEITSLGGLSADDKERVAAYLQKQNEHELVTELVPAEEAFTEYPLFLRRTESLLELGRWREVGAMCASPSAPALPQSRLLSQTLAVLYKPGPQTCMAERLLLDAFNESREVKGAAACYATGCAALDHRLPDLAGSAFAAALELSKDRRTTMEAIINSSRHGSLTVAQLLRAFESTNVFSDETVQNQLIYLHLLANRNVDHMTEVVRQRRQRNPDDVYLRFLESFAMHLHGDYAQAARLLVPLPRYRWHQGEAAVIAGIVVASGNFDRSAGLLSKISIDDLFAEERQMAEPWQQRALAGPASLLSKAEFSDSQ